MSIKTITEELIVLGHTDLAQVLATVDEDKRIAKKLLDFYIKKVGKDSKKVRQEILDNFVNNPHVPPSNDQVTLMWDLYNEVFSSNEAQASEPHFENGHQVSPGDPDEYTEQEMCTLLKKFFPKLKEHVNEWSVRDTLIPYTAWGIWLENNPEGEMVSIDMPIAKRIINCLAKNLDEIRDIKDLKKLFGDMEHYMSIWAPELL